MLKPDKMKGLIDGALEHLSNAGKTDVFSLVIRPNHPDKSGHRLGSWLHESKLILCYVSNIQYILLM